MKTANLTSVAIAALLGIIMLAGAGCTNSKTNQETSDNMETLNLTQEWDKKFPQSDKVNHRKVTFKNRYGIIHPVFMHRQWRNVGSLLLHLTPHIPVRVAVNLVM